MDLTDLYLRVREKEGRLYPDDVVSRLPEFPGDQTYSVEWRIRAESCARLTHYLAGLKRPLSILDLGCGNGWLSSHLSNLPQSRVCGLDRLSSELEQAARVFPKKNLTFISTDIFSAPFIPESFDVIVLASVIQYFPDLESIILALKPLLKPRGEIHLLDSPLYPTDELLAARQRTQEYYASLGFPEMSDYYFHHSVTALEGFSPHWLYHPNQLAARIKHILGQSPSPFPWIVVR